MQITE